MKKVLSLVLAFVFVVGICASAPITANAASVDDLTFELNDDGQSYSVSDCSTSASGEIVIPSTYNGLPVTSIGDYAFGWCDSITSITIPGSVTSIGDYAFWGCKSLTSVTIPDSVTSIGEAAFSNTGYYNDNSNWENNVLYICKHLIEAKEEILGAYTIKSGTKTIAEYAFSSCTALTVVTIPDSVKSIGVDAFYNCTSLTSITIPDSVKSIGDYTFYDCSSLTSVTIGDSVKSIGNGAFYDCTSLTSITIPDSVTSIGVSAFRDCTSLTSITIPDGVSSISAYAFSGCTSLTSITIPTGVTSIENYTFHKCTSLVKVTIPNSVTSIAYASFRNCNSLKNIEVPKSVTSIGDQAFGYYGNSKNSEYYKIEGFTIYGVKSSEAERYANDNGFAFVDSLLISPTILTTESTEKGVKFTWSAVEGADGYTVFKLVQDSTGNYIYKALATVGASTLAFTDWTAVDGETYCYAVCAMDNYGATSPYAEFAFTYVKPILLATPTVKVANTAKGIKVSWNKVDNAQKYVVYRRFYSPTNKRWSGWVALKTTTGLSFTDTTTKIGINYRYTVKAVNGKSASAFKSTPTIKYNVVPTVTVANASNGIKVSWSTVANATGYTVYSSTYNAKTKKWSGWKNRGTTKANAKSWVDKSAKAGTIYKYTVRARYGSAASSFKASANIVRLLNPTVKVAKASNGVKVTWNKISGAKNYKIYRAQYVNGKWSGWSGIATTNNKTFAYVDKTAKKGVYYKYTVRAVNGKSASAFTASKNVKR